MARVRISDMVNGPLPLDASSYVEASIPDPGGPSGTGYATYRYTVRQVANAIGGPFLPLSGGSIAGNLGVAGSIQQGLPNGVASQGITATSTSYTEIAAYGNGTAGAYTAIGSDATAGYLAVSGGLPLYIQTGGITRLTIAPNGAVTLAASPALSSDSTQLATTEWVKDQGYGTGAPGITALSGDVSATGPGAVAATLATVNSNVGIYQGLTIDAKGRVTAAVAQNYLTQNQTISLGGDLSGSGATSITGTVTGLQGRPVSSTAPSASQVLQWSGSTWAPATPAPGGAIATVGDVFPTVPAPVQGQLHWLSTDGQLYVRYGTAWIIAVTASSALPPGTSANDNLIYNGSVWAAQRPRYGVSFSFVGGLLGASQLLGIHCFTKAVTFNANFSGWLGHTPEAGGTASATASTVITVERALVASPNSWSGVGTITIAAGSINPTFSSSAAVNFSVGDRMRLVGPSTPDPTFQNFYCSLVGREA